MYTIKLNNIKTTLSQDHRWCRCIKDSSALEDRTFDQNNVCDLGGALGFSPTTGVIIRGIKVPLSTPGDAELQNYILHATLLSLV